MGEAKRKREALRRMMLEKGSEWDFPASDWEADLCAELEALPVLIVPRAPADQLASTKMKANECHTNTFWYVGNDPNKISCAVTGWWVQEPCYVLHSVIEQDGRLICITPSAFGETEIPFVPDPKISWQIEGDVRHAMRNGIEIGPGIRKFPALTMAINSIVRERLLAGANPFQAGNFSDEEVAELKRKHGAR